MVSGSFLSMNKERFLENHKGHDIKEGGASDGGENSFKTNHVVIICKTCDNFFVDTKSKNKSWEIKQG